MNNDRTNIEYDDSYYLEKYRIVLEKYYEAQNNNYDNYDYDYIGFSDMFVVPPYSKVSYALYDIDNNGVPELVIGTDFEAIVSIWALNAGEPARLIEYSFMWRSRGHILNSGIIFGIGNGGATCHVFSFYRITENGYTVELEKHIHRDGVMNRDGNYYVTIIQTDADGSEQEISEEEFDVIMMSYIGMTFFAYDEDMLDTVELDWKTVDSFFANG